MRTRWLDSVSVCALVALTAALYAVPRPAIAEPAAASIEAAVPMPEPAGVPPPSAADIDAVASDNRGVSDHAAHEALSGTVSSGAAQPSAPASTEGAVPAAEPANAQPAATAEAAAPALAPADQAVADQLRELLAKRGDRFIEGKAERAALTEFYQARNYAPVWIEQGAPSPRMQAAIARLKAADADGLDASAYATPDPASLTDPEAIARAELTLQNALLAFAKHAQSGRVDPTRISVNIEVNPPVPEPASILKVLAEAADVTATLENFNPPHEGFQRLRAKLAEMRGTPEERVVQIPSGPAVRMGRKDNRVPALRQRLKVDGDPDNTTYDAALAEAVKAFQKSRNIRATGLLTPETVNALNGRSRNRDVNTILANMERWRWLPRELGQSYVMINLPDFTLKVIRDREPVFRTRIVAGKPRTPSPVFSDEIETMQLNPTWHVPQSIIYGEYLPALSQDPGALARMGLILSRARDGTVSVRQPPGERNALGRIKFNFPNRYQVYLHDTPQKHLFSHDRRAYSAGCMRVENPDQFGEMLASIAMPEEGYTSARLKRMYGANEQWVKFKKFVPVHLVYMNAFVDDNGSLVVREDVYGYDGRVQSALNGRYVVVHERSQVVMPGRPSVAGGYGGGAASTRSGHGYGRTAAPAPSPFWSWFGAPDDAPPRPSRSTRGWRSAEQPARQQQGRGARRQAEQQRNAFPSFQFYRDRAGL